MKPARVLWGMDRDEHQQVEFEREQRKKRSQRILRVAEVNPEMGLPEFYERFANSSPDFIRRVLGKAEVQRRRFVEQISETELRNCKAPGGWFSLGWRRR